MDDQLELNALQHSQVITVEDQTSKGMLTPRELFNAIWAVNYQVMFQYGRSAWVTHRLAPAAHLMPLPKGVAPPKGAWNIILIDTADQAGALGWHDDGENDIPYAEVFVKTSREDGVQWSEVLSHEALEMIVDPFVDPAQPRTVKHNGKLWIVEVGDPVQGCGYDVGAPEHRSTGVLVADFAEPSWFGLLRSGESVQGPFSFRDSVASPFELAQQGYMSVASEADPNNWEQIYGEMRTRHPAWASRLPRVHNA